MKGHAMTKHKNPALKDLCDAIAGEFADYGYVVGADGKVTTPDGQVLPLHAAVSMLLSSGVRAS